MRGGGDGNNGNNRDDVEYLRPLQAPSLKPRKSRVTIEDDTKEAKAVSEV